MNRDLSDIVCAIAGHMAGRSLDHAGRGLENLYVKSTAEGTSPEEQAAFNPTLIAQVLEVAKQDNAKMTVDWAIAIHDELQARIATAEPDYIVELKKRLLSARQKERSLARTLTEIKDGRAYPTFSTEARERQAAGTQRALRETQEDISSLEKDLRDLRESASEILGRPPQEGPLGAEHAGYDDLDGNLPPMS